MMSRPLEITVTVESLEEEMAVRAQSNRETMTMDRVQARAKLAEVVMEVPTTKRPSLFLTMLREEMSRRSFNI